jgi:uncharacterized RDD family membrane protein YckC
MESPISGAAQSLQANRPQYAGLGRRFLALVVDFLIFSAIFFPVTKAVKGVWIMSPQDHAWGYGWFITDPLCLTFLVIMVMYFVLLEGLAGATIGKRLLRLRVVGTDGQRPGLGRGALRNVLRVVDSLPALNILGVALILTSAERARFGDRIAKTRVIIEC